MLTKALYTRHSLENILLRFLTCHTTTGDVYTHLQQIHLDKSSFIFSLNSFPPDCVSCSKSQEPFFLTLTCFCGSQISSGIEVKALASCPRLGFPLVWSSKSSCVSVEWWVRTDSNLLQPPHAVLLCCSETSLCPLPPSDGRKVPATCAELRGPAAGGVIRWRDDW